LKLALQKQSCADCDGKAVKPNYVPSKDIDIYRWCFCCAGLQEAKLNGSKPGQIVPDHILEKYLGKIEEQSVN
jgi:hypothetical protein